MVENSRKDYSQEIFVGERKKKTTWILSKGLEYVWLYSPMYAATL